MFEKGETDLTGRPLWWAQRGYSGAQDRIRKVWTRIFD